VATQQHSALSLEDVLEPYQSGVVAIEYSPDGKLLATAHSFVSEVGSRVHVLGPPPAFVKLWDVQDQINLATFRVGDRMGQTVRFAPDGKSLVVRSENKLFGWDIERQSLTPETIGPVAAVSPDCQLVAGWRREGQIPVINALDGTEKMQLTAGPDAMAVAFSPDTSLLAVANVPLDGERYVDIWNLASGEPQARMPALRGSGVWSCSFSPDGKLLATAMIDYQHVDVWDTQTGRLHAQLVQHSGAVWSLAFSPDGELIASGSEGTEGGEIRLWDVALGRQQGLVVDDSTWGITAMAFSPDGTRLATGDGDGNIKVWKIAELRSESRTL